MVVVPESSSSSDETNNLKEEKTYVLSTEKATITLKLHDDNLDDNLSIVDKLLIPHKTDIFGFCKQDLYLAIYQITENNCHHKLTNKLSLEWDKNKTAENINKQLEQINEPNSDNPRLTRLNNIINKCKRRQFIEIKITNKTDENNPIELPYIFMVKQETKLEKLYQNIINLHHKELSTKLLSDITLKLQHPHIFFINLPEKTFKELGFHNGNLMHESIENFYYQIKFDKDEDKKDNKIKLENYESFKTILNNDDDNSQLRKLLIDDRSFEGLIGENSELSLNTNTWPDFQSNSTSLYEDYEKEKKTASMADSGCVDWNKISQNNDVKLPQSPLDNAIELFDNNESIKCDYKNSDIVDNETTTTTTTTKYVGLINQAMTCYLNSLLQALYMTPEFRNALYNWEYIDGQERDEATSIPYQLQKLFLNLQTSDKTAIETTSLTKSFGWDSAEAWHQHDVQELCRVMFDALEQKFKNTEQSDLINRLYEGKMIDYVKCLECQTEKSREDTFLDIPLPVRPFGSNIAYDNIQEALRAFVQPETLDGVNQYYCETCNKKCDAHKGLKFTKFPYLLTLHLKRFDFDYNTLQRIKLNDKVSFPNVLNLNSFITNDDDESSPITDEDVGVKCDDSSTTDSVGWDEFLPPIKNGFSSSSSTSTSSTTVNATATTTTTTTGDVNNHEQDDDEGIDMSNGPSTSSTNSNDNNNDKYCTKSGPYNYELFSILIHSGSASGGHYYAYIKDFKTNNWICFNDQNLSSVTNNDIQRTFGGGQTRTYYSGYYSSSTNAYMLMYRQIDDKRNCLPMTIDNFPPHIKELLEKIKNTNDDDDNNRKQQIQRETKPMIKIRVSLLHPIERVYKNKKIYSFDSSDEKLQDIVYRLYKEFSLDTIIDIDQCRLVYWDPTNEFIQWSYENKDNDKIIDLLDNCKDEYTDCHEMLLEIRDKNTKFKRYLPGGCKISIYQVDLIKKEIIDGPFNTRGLLSQTICEFKKQLADEYCTNYDNILCCIVKCSVPLIILDNNDAELRNQGFYSGCNNKVFLTTRDTVKQLNYTNTDIQNIFLKLSDDLDNIIRLTINLPDMSKEILDEMNISLLDNNNDKKFIINNDIDVQNSMKIKNKIIDDDSGFCSGSNSSSNKDDADKNKESLLTTTTTTTTTTSESSEECQEQTSNSEDSSQSDSDRTLVGDNTSEDDYDYRYNLFLSSQNEQNDDKKYCKIIKHKYKNNDNMYLNILVDKKMTLETFTIKIQQYIGISKNCFKLIPLTNDDITDIDCKNLNTKFNLYNDNTIIDLKLNRILGKNEYKIQLYQLNLNPTSIGSTLTLLFDFVVVKDTTIEQLKNIIQRDMKVKLNVDINIDRMRLRKKIYQTPSKKLFNQQKINDLISSHQAEIPNFTLSFILQELDNDNDVVVDDKQVILIVKLYTGIAEDNQPYQEVVLSSQSSTMEELRDKIAELSGIPGDCLMFAKGRWPAGQATGRIQWISADDEKPQFLDGDVYFYKNTSEKQREDLNKTKWESTDTSDRRLLRDNRTPAVSTYRRRERALKIYVDDK